MTAADVVGARRDLGLASELHVPGDGRGTDCDEDQFSIPEVAPDGTLYVHFLNGQNEAAWEVDFDFDNQIMVVKLDRRRRAASAPRACGAARGRSQRHAVLRDRSPDRLGASDPLDVGRQHLGEPERPGQRDRRVVRPRDAESERHRGMLLLAARRRARLRPMRRRAELEHRRLLRRSIDGGATWSGRLMFDAAPGHQWFPWADHKSDGSLAVAWDEDVQPAGGVSPINDQFVHVSRPVERQTVTRPAGTAGRLRDALGGSVCPQPTGRRCAVPTDTLIRRSPTPRARTATSSTVTTRGSQSTRVTGCMSSGPA